MWARPYHRISPTLRHPKTLSFPPLQQNTYDYQNPRICICSSEAQHDTHLIRILDLFMRACLAIYPIPKLYIRRSFFLVSELRLTGAVPQPASRQRAGFIIWYVGRVGALQKKIEAPFGRDEPKLA